ncbi:hypothetical protein BU26DRAFT_557105 [Trematosphaeria pertusa]|uniref:Nudix hydrolase domain-containing protein n=1 Tax=Trematosphaeria pertusa TaxID=390896 RepID=A0A6A6J0B2_9PLEO|nr:uncharacterized protein BU26DRAFT_557105 [Trematosphaeria pertusa]KAF2255592.1 hypothetical protein BU26DRAFT_557105 [Trematosphaeria pertusa]
MAKSRVPTRQLPSEQFVESCGAVLFDLSDPLDKKICLIRVRDTGEWHLAKGRRNCGEARRDAALREVREETGHRCRLFPVTMPTRATPAHESPNFKDKAQVYDDLMEPFMCTIRDLKRPQGVKIIWWFIAALEADDDEAEKLPGEARYEPKFLPCKEAIQTLTFLGDRDILVRAIELVEGKNTLPLEDSGASEKKKNPKSKKGIKRKQNAPKDNQEYIEAKRQMRKEKRERARIKRAQKKADKEAAKANGDTTPGNRELQDHLVSL